MTDSAKQTKRKRRWLRFSLRSFLIILTILTVWIGWYVVRAEQQREAVKWVQENGGMVLYDYVYDHQKFTPNSQPPVPKWLINMLGVDYFSSVSLVDLSDTQVSDVTPLAGLSKLEYLEITDTKVSDVAALTGLTNLGILSLDGTQVSDVTALAGLVSLKILKIQGTQVTDEQVKKLQQALPDCFIGH